MTNFREWVLLVQTPDYCGEQRRETFGKLVEHFQGMAYGCAYAILRDSHLAQDAAQEAFIVAYQQVTQLRDPNAFPAWLRRIVLTQCNRLTRGKRLPLQSLDETNNVASPMLDPALALEELDLKTTVLAAIEKLPEHERVVVRLFYLDDYSLKEVAERLELPVTTIKKRLQYARQRLRQQMVAAHQYSVLKYQLFVDDVRYSWVQIVSGFAPAKPVPCPVYVHARVRRLRRDT